MLKKGINLFIINYNKKEKPASLVYRNLFMKNIVIPPYISLGAGIVLIILVRILLNTEQVIPQFIQFFGFILVIIGIGGTLGKLLGKERPIAQYEYSKPIAYALSFIMTVLVLLNWQDLVPVFWSVILLFVFALMFNGGLGGKTVAARFPFYLAVISFVLFIVLIFLSLM